MKRVVIFMIVVCVLAFGVCVQKYVCCLGVISRSVERIGNSSIVRCCNGHKEMLLELDSNRVCKIRGLLGSASPLLFPLVKSVCLWHLVLLDKDGNAVVKVWIFKNNIVKIEGCYFALSSDLASAMNGEGFD